MGLRLCLGLKFGDGAETGAEDEATVKTGAEYGSVDETWVRTGAEDGPGAKTGAKTGLITRIEARNWAKL